MVRLCLVNFQGILLIWIIVGQGLTALVADAIGGRFGLFFSRLSFLFSFSLFLGDGPILTEILYHRAVKPKTTNFEFSTWYSLDKTFLLKICRRKCCRLLFSS